MIFPYQPDDTFIIYGTRYSCVHQTDALCVLEPKDPAEGETKTLSRTEISFLRRSNNWRYIPGPRTKERMRATASRGTKALQLAHPDDRESAILTLPPTFIQRERDSGFEFCR
ncbi:hypothetical protein, partial [Puniceibacterium antarcticum]|uniref:hypothetical protein n=1 Tax=Puniceibacterium antarcticum TaxID=1206336 RepID=UPI001C5581D3